MVMLRMSQPTRLNSNRKRPNSKELHMTDKNDMVIAIAASLYTTRATKDAIRAEPDMQVIAAEAWDLYYKLEHAVRSSPRRDGDGALDLPG
jgi:hypothetical protein